MDTNGFSKGELSPKQIQAITALLSHPTMEQAAKSADVARRTLYQWLSEPAFKAALTEAESAAIDHAVRGLVSLVEPAMETLKEALAPEQKMVTRLRAVTLILEQMLKLVELRSFDARLTELERIQANEQKYKAFGLNTDGYGQDAGNGYDDHPDDEQE